MKMIENIKEDISLAPYNSFGVEVKSRYFFDLMNVGDIAKIASCPKPLLFLGGGSNILFTQDYPGTVVLNSLKGVEVLEETDAEIRIRSMAGEDWHDFVVLMNEQGFHGLEYLALIPGSVGAAPVQNIGAYGAEVSQYIERVNVYDFESSSFKSLCPDECQFSYRDSIFKRTKNRYLIVSVEFKLFKKMVPAITYRALLDFFRTSEMEIDDLHMDDILRAVIAVRSSKLPDPKKIGNAGSFFKNPLIPVEQADRLKLQIDNLVLYPQKEGAVKLAAGQLIELAGFKGQYVGNVGMYDKQALVLVNLGGATGEMLLAHAQKVQAEVEKRFGVVLEAEPLIL